jgi:hypothetical protein
MLFKTACSFVADLATPLLLKLLHLLLVDSWVLCTEPHVEGFHSSFFLGANLLSSSSTSF